MPYVHLDGVTYHYQMAGQGPLLVLLHGFTGSVDNWRPHFPALATRYRLLAVDLLGHGRTSAPATPTRYAMDAAAADLAALLARLTSEPAHLLGYSMGGRLALYVALTYPAQVKSLYLESASPGLEDGEARRQRQEQDEALADRIEQAGVPAFVDFWETLPLFASQQRLPAHVRSRLRRQRLQNRAHGLASSLRGMGTGVQPSLWSRLGELQMPVHLLVGALDSKFVALNRHMAQALPQATLTVVPDAGHAVHLEQPQRFQEWLLSTSP